MAYSHEIDVLVVGGGTAGTIAAIQAARDSASTMLIEAGSQLGGVTTTGGVSMPGLFHAWGRQVIAGIGWDLVRRTVELGNAVMPDFTQIPDKHWKHQIRLSGPLYAALAEEAAVDAQVRLCYYEFPIHVEYEQGMWSVELAGRGGVRRHIRCRQLVDCTGGADIVGMLGLPRLRDEHENQPGTLIFRIGGYDCDALDATRVEQLYQQALADGMLVRGDYAYPDRPFMSFLRGHGVNAQHVHGADSSDSAAQTRTNIRGRRSLLRLMRFIRTLPGCENVVLEQAQTETAVRETYRIVGRVQITRDDYYHGRRFDDAVCHSFYPIDLHTAEGCTPRMLPEGVVPTVPLRALSPRDQDNLLVAGRCVSSDREANSALRVQASSMAMGQAAGAAAALAAKRGITPLDVPLDAIRTLLVEHGAIVPEV